MSHVNKDRLNYLRKKAEDRLRASESLITENSELKDLIHELSVYQEELEAQRLQLEESQAESQSLASKFAMLFDLAPVGYVIVDQDGHIVEFNQKAIELLRISSYAAYRTGSLRSNKFTRYINVVEGQRKIRSWLSSESTRPLEIHTHRSPNQWLQLNKVSLETVDHLELLSLTDITDQVIHKRSLEAKAHYDQLTNLPNRELLLEILKQNMARAKRSQTSFAVVFLDLDGFKKVNDDYGHEVGDNLLVEVGHRIKNMLRAEDTLARYGGDEFIILVEDAVAHVNEGPVLTRILSCVSGIKFIDNLPVDISASVGVTTYPQSKNIGPEQLIRQADIAMYQAKQSGKNDYRIYQVDDLNSIDDAHRMRKLILENLADNNFEIYYQPKVNMDTNHVDGFEALLRWNHPERGLLTPDSFMSAINTVELSNAVDHYVIHHVLEDLVIWKDIEPNIQVSINVSALYLKDRTFLQYLTKIMNEYPEVNANQITFEITETFTLSNISESAKVIQECQKLGLGFSMDDFGTGYSSLSYLKELPINELKIDRTFIRDMFFDKSDMELVKVIVYLSKAFGLKTVAEGVETEEQWDALRELGCDVAQGFLISPAIHRMLVPDWLRNFKVDL